MTQRALADAEGNIAAGDVTVDAQDLPAQTPGARHKTPGFRFEAIGPRFWISFQDGLFAIG